MKVLFIITAILYILLGFSARLSVPFIDMRSFDRVVSESLPILIGLSLIIGVAFSQWFKVAFPLGHANQKKLMRVVGFPIMFSAVSFAANQAWLFTLNTMMPKNSKTLNLTVSNKSLQKSRRSTSYRLVVQDLVSAKAFEFKVGEYDYNRIETGDTLNMNIKRGVFDIYYGELTKTQNN